jgi:hypothetical protein
MLHNFSILLNIYRGALAELNRRSLVRRQRAQDELDAALRAVEEFERQAAQQMKTTERKTVPRKNILANVVIICLLVSSAYIAWKHSQTSTTKRKSSSPSTQMALLENYFGSEFSSSFTILGLQIVGAHPPPPPPPLTLPAPLPQSPLPRFTYIFTYISSGVYLAVTYFVGF